MKNFRIWIDNFFRKNGRKIFIIVVLLLIIIFINKVIADIQKEKKPSKLYQPHKPIIQGKEIKSKSKKEKISDVIDEYMKLCVDKQYEEAFNMVSEDCRKSRFSKGINQYKEYIDAILFDQATYNIQSYSNKDNIYIYNVNIVNDFMAEGRFEEENQYNEKIALIENGDSYKIGIAGFIQSEPLDIVAEDDYMKIKVEKKDIYYDRIIYDVKIKNKTIYDIVLERDNEENAIEITVSGNKREEIKENYKKYEKAIDSNHEANFKIQFPHFFDEDSKLEKISFEKVRILEEYSRIKEKYEEEEKNAIKKYSMSFNIK